MPLFTKKDSPEARKSDVGQVTKTLLATTKRVTITFVDRNKPDFKFEGEWAGRDILVAAKSIVRAYRILQLSRRRPEGHPVVSDEVLQTT